MRTAAVSLLLFIFALATAARAQQPTYTVHRRTETLVIDGVLDDPDWAAAESTGDFVFGWWEETSTDEQTEVKMVWDDDFLYVAYHCTDRHIRAEHYTTNSTTYKDDCVEFFWNPRPDIDMSYNMFEINCIGNLLSVHNLRGFERDIHARESRILPPHIAQSIHGTLNDDSDTDEGWIIEMAVRFEDYGEHSRCRIPRDGTIWKVGLNRCGGKTDALQSQWSPTREPRRGFHNPQDFGTLVFSSDPVTR